MCVIWANLDWCVAHVHGSKEHSDTLPHSYFRSRKLWTICHCIIFQVKPTENPASTLPYTFTQITIHNSCSEKQSFYRLLFLCLLVFPQIDINVFLTDFIVDNVVIHVQWFSTGILTNFCQKLCVKCEGIWFNVWLTCTLLAYRNFVWYDGMWVNVWLMYTVNM